MKSIVLDTNVLVSALWSPDSKPFRIVEMIFTNEIAICYAHPIIDEYRRVLARPKLNFSQDKVHTLLDRVESKGLLVKVVASTLPLPDESDRIFYDVAKACNALLITGNKKHFPDEAFIITPADFLHTL